MKMFLYKTENLNNDFTKELTLLDTKEITLRKGIDIFAPSLILTNLPKECNYIYIDKLERAYFIKTKESYNNEMTRVDLKTDILETFKKQLMNSTVEIDKTDIPSYFDGSINNSVLTEKEYFYSNVTLNENESTILITVGG